MKTADNHGNREGDVILVYYQDEPTVYARIESIEPDVKKGWYQLTLLLLTIPPQNVTWILREEYINGATFTMGGKEMRLDPVRGEAPVPREEIEQDPHSGQKGGDKNSKVIPFKKPL